MVRAGSPEKEAGVGKSIGGEPVFALAILTSVGAA